MYTDMIRRADDKFIATQPLRSVDPACVDLHLGLLEGLQLSIAPELSPSFPPCVGHDVVAEMTLGSDAEVEVEVP